MLSDIPEWALSSGAVGILGFLAWKLVLPIINAVSSRAQTESTVYRNANETIDRLSKKNEQLQEQVIKLTVENAELNLKLAKLTTIPEGD